ncbi:MAG: methylenetetrahydrofolate reductase, partial [Spirochaetaceae bacterium]|nr:methylenetetrahydrofolate reductase [Spirochaetaceae bacterium]
NLLVLRGDKIEGRNPCNEFLHASDLISFIEEKMPGKFYLMGACYPENHPESKDTVEEIRNLKTKVNCGASHLLSQLFFDNDQFFRFVENCRIAGIDVPVEAGIMPVTNRTQIERMTDRCGVVLPEKYRIMMEKYGTNDESILEAGIVYAANQIVELLARGADGIHLYTMNKPYVARRIAGVFAALTKS